MRSVVTINISLRRGRPNSAARISKRLALCATTCLRARRCIRALKADSQRPLHHARRAGRDRLAETGIGLNDLIVDVIEDQIGVNVVEIRVVEKIIRLPAELETNLLAHAEVLEHRQVKVDESGTAKQISRRIA